MANIKFGEEAAGGTSYQAVRPAITSTSNKCAKCGTTVYMAEELLAAGKKWHKTCFKCKGCRKPLDSSIMLDHEGELYCKSCHGRRFSISGYGYGIGAGALSSIGNGQTDATDNPHAARRVSTQVRGEAGYVGWSADGKKYQPAKRDVAVSANKCPKCGKAVYMAEEVLAAGKKWHKMCFKCTGCKKLLDSTTMREHEGTLYCKSCHGRRFGISGYGYGIGAGTLASEQGVKKGDCLPSSPTAVSNGNGDGVVANGNGTKCSCCDEVVPAGQELLDSTSEGPVYCKGCHGKQFAPKEESFGLEVDPLTA